MLATAGDRRRITTHPPAHGDDHGPVTRKGQPAIISRMLPARRWPPLFKKRRNAVSSLLRSRTLVSAATVTALFLGATLAVADDVLTPWDVARIRSASSAVPSPDGSRIAYLLSVPRDPFKEDDGPSWQELHVVEVASGKDLTFVSRESLAQPQWTPDGRGVSFLAKRGDDKTRGALPDSCRRRRGAPCRQPRERHPQLRLEPRRHSRGVPCDAEGAERCRGAQEEGLHAGGLRGGAAQHTGSHREGGRQGGQPGAGPAGVGGAGAVEPRRQAPRRRADADAARGRRPDAAARARRRRGERPRRREPGESRQAGRGRLEPGQPAHRDRHRRGPERPGRRPPVGPHARRKPLAGRAAQLHGARRRHRVDRPGQDRVCRQRGRRDGARRSTRRRQRPAGPGGGGRPDPAVGRRREVGPAGDHGRLTAPSRRSVRAGGRRERAEAADDQQRLAGEPAACTAGGRHAQGARRAGAAGHPRPSARRERIARRSSCTSTADRRRTSPTAGSPATPRPARSPPRAASPSSIRTTAAAPAAASSSRS